MIKAILTLSALNIALLPVVYLVHVNALDLRDCSVASYLASDSIGAKFTECTSPRAYFIMEPGQAPESAFLSSQGDVAVLASN